MYHNWKIIFVLFTTAQYFYYNIWIKIDDVRK